MTYVLCAHNTYIDKVLYMYILSLSFFWENPSMVANSCNWFSRCCSRAWNSSSPQYEAAPAPGYLKRRTQFEVKSQRGEIMLFGFPNCVNRQGHESDQVGSARSSTSCSDILDNN